MTDRFWRTIVRITYVSNTSVRFQVSGWSSRKYVTRQRSIFPEPLRSALVPNLRVHVKATTGAEKASDLHFKGWEWDGSTVEQQAERIRRMQTEIDARSSTVGHD